MSKPSESPFHVTAKGEVRLRVRLTPKSSRDAVEGVEATAQGLALKVRVRAVPEDGKANAALERLVAEWLEVARSCVEVAAGHTSRLKTLRITGDGAALAREIATRIDSVANSKGTLR